MKRGYRRKGKETAFLRFAIGLIALILLVALGYWVVGVMDYSSRLTNTDAIHRTYVLAEGADPIVLPTPTINPEATPLVAETATPAPTAEPTPTPTPEPTAEPTPEPTAIPDDASTRGQQRDSLPTMNENAVLGITKCYVSVPNNYEVMEINGYCYLNEADFDGANCDTWLVATMETSNGYKYLAYPVEHVEGISGVQHDSVCANPGASDFRVFIDVKRDGYQDGVYSLGIVLGYKVNGETKYAYCSFSNTTTTFTVLKEQVVKIVPVSGAQDRDVG